MYEANNFSSYGDYGHKVYGFQEYADTGFSDEYNYYGTPQLPSFSGGYLFDHQDQSYNYGDYPYSYGAYYEYYPVYYLYPTYLGYYPSPNFEYSLENIYCAYYVYIPVQWYYYMPNLIYYTSPTTYNASDLTYYADPSSSYESQETSSTMEKNFDAFQEFNCNFCNIGNRCYNVAFGSYEQKVEDGTTSCVLQYEELSETLNDTPFDDKVKSLSTNDKLANEIISNEAEEIESTSVFEESYSMETNLCEDDIDKNVIRKVSFMSIEEVKEDIDDNYEDGKAFVYNAVLKGYIETKNQLEELEWECHTLDDIPEEEEPESDSSVMDLIENVLLNLENSTVKKTYLSDVEKMSSSLSEESLTDSSEEALQEKCQLLSDESQTVSHEEGIFKECRLLYEESKTSSNEEALVEECNSLTAEAKTASNEKELIEGCGSLCEVSQTAYNDEKLVEKCGSLSGESQTTSNGTELIEGSGSLCEESQTSSIQASLQKEHPTQTEESKLSTESLVVEENPEMETVPDSGSISNCENPYPSLTSQDLMEENAAAPKIKKRKKRFERLRKFFARICCCITKPP